MPVQMFNSTYLDLPVVNDPHGFTETNVSKANYPDPGPQSKTDASI
jgi:hypothetical protein